MESVTQAGEKRKVSDSISESKVVCSKAVKLESRCPESDELLIDLTSEDETSTPDAPSSSAVRPEAILSVSMGGTVDLTSDDDDDDDDVYPEQTHSQSVVVKVERGVSHETPDLVDLTSDDDEVQIIQKDNTHIHADLEYVYDQMEIHVRSRKELERRGIVDIKKLLERRNDFKEKQLIGVKRSTQEALYHFCLWYEDFHKKKCNEGKSWRDHFTSASFEKFEENVVHLLKEETKNSHQGLNAQDLFNEVMKTLHDEEGELDRMSPNQLEVLHDYTAELAFKDIPKALLEKCQFNVKEFVKKVVKAIFHTAADKQYKENILLVAGWTQAGKSTVKAVMACVCELLRCPLYIMTKGVAESKDLKLKLKSLISGEADDPRIKSWWNDGQSNRTTDSVFADTAAQIRKVTKNIKSYRANVGAKAKFLLIVDECDAMYRTEGRHQKMEQAFDDLISLSPTFRVEISATFIPAALYLACLEGLKCNLFLLGTSDDYSGVTAMKPLDDEKGNSIFLDDSIVPKHGIPYNVKKSDLVLKRDSNGGGSLFGDDDELERAARNFSSFKKPNHIPSTGGSVIKLCNDALLQNKKGVLLLDCTNNRVTAENNVFEKASCIQNLYATKGQEMVIVVSVGRGIYFRRPGYLFGRFVKSQKTISNVIEQLDEEFGLSVPIFVFGYSKMRRCISFRSEKRVPTHMVLSLGQAQSNESYIQALGRATFNGLNSVLKSNGHSHVTVLTSGNDLLMAQSNQNFVKELVERTQCGISLKDALSDVQELFPCEANYTLHTSRKTGQIKDLKDHLPGQECFEEPQTVSGTLVKSLREDDDLGLKVVDVMVELKEEDDNYTPTTKDIQAKYNHLYVEERTNSIKMEDLRKNLRKLKVKGILVKKDNDKWTAKNWGLMEKTRLKMNDRIGGNQPNIIIF